LSRPRAAAVVTGSELVRGDRNDRNGPFFMRQALALGLQPARVIVVGDDDRDLERALREALDDDICFVSGGLGPTHDDRTVEVVARVTGRALVLDHELEQRIEAFSRTVAERLRRPYADFVPGVTKQATIPEGAHVLGLAGTAPGLVLDHGEGAIVVLPGPPGELQRLWPRAVASPPVERVLRRAVTPSRRVLRLYGVSESAVARALEEAGGDGGGVEATICARDFEIHVDLVADPGAEDRAASLAGRLRAPLERYVFAEDERTVEALVLELCRDRGLTLGVAESCTGGLVAARLTSVAGASDVFRGGVVAYADGVKQHELDVPADVLASHGAVSAEVARAMAEGARSRLGVDVAVAVTGVAGPGGGTLAKPVGLVLFHAVSPGGEEAFELELPGDREWIRARSATAALHLLRQLLTRTRHEVA
jgi:competence/damage-inducible protein CinA-like protein